MVPINFLLLLKMVKHALGFRGFFFYGFVWVLSFLVISTRCQDAEVMQILKNTINAPVSFQWTGPNVCKWRHVECDASKRVTGIQFGNQNLQGYLPKELVNLTSLERFECQSNSLVGPFPYLSKSLQKLIIRDNKFSFIPYDFFKGMSSLQEVRIDDNPFSQWHIPITLKECGALQTFSAQSAGLIGTVPDIFGRDDFPGLILLALSNNFLEGPLPASLSGSSIENLLVNGQNSFSKLNGTLDVLHSMKSLKQIVANGNSFTGPIPDLSHHDQLGEVNLRDNQLTGVVPPSLMALPSLKFVNLTNNFLQGSPPRFKDGVGVDNSMDKGKNQYCTNVLGQPCSPLVNALLSVAEPLGYPLKFAQNWQGDDPCVNKWIGIVCSGGNISVINFQNMGLSGVISPSFASLTSVTKLLIANNGLSGTIPRELTSLPILKELDVSNNHLYGKVPSFRKDVVLKFGGNPDIGKDKPITGFNSGSNGNNNYNNTGVIVGTVVVVVMVLVIGVLILVKFKKRWKLTGKTQNPSTVMVLPHHYEDGNAAKISGGSYGEGTISALLSPARSVYQVETGNMLISIEVLREVTNNFSEENILGKGGFGTVYKGELHDGTKIAVKRMQSEGLVDKKGLSEFTAEIAVLTKVRHKNLVALLGFCLDGSERLLVYEYMPQGALSIHLINWKDRGLKPLEWKTRLSIALDVARGVEYLHGLAQQIFIHRDLKPSNILLGDDMRAKVSDFGLVRLAPEGKTSFQTRLAGTFGYMAPEYAVTGRLTTKVDVYSFGVILMEMITGRKALDDSLPEENIHLVTWFRKMLLNKDSFQSIIDPAIKVDEETLASINTVAELAGHCCAREPYQRPDMSHAVNVLSPLIEVWKPSEIDGDDDIYGINFDMTLPEALKRWQAFEGSTTTSELTSSSMHFNGNNIKSNTQTEPSVVTRPYSSSGGQ